MASRAAVIVNAHARRFVERPTRIADVMSLARGRAPVFVTRSRAELEAAVKSAREAEAEVVVLCGGDGSYSAGASEIHRQYIDSERPILAFAPGGTIGTVARALHVTSRGGFVDAFARVLDLACSSTPPTLTTPSLLIEADDRPARVGFIFGTGLVASFFRLYDRREADEETPSIAVGLAGAAAIVARIFVESFVGGPYARRVLEPMRCDVDVDVDGTLRRLPWSSSSLVLTAVVRDLGLHMLVPYRAGEDPMRPHVVVSGLPTRVLGPRMPRVLLGKSIGDAGEPHFDDLARRLIVSFPDGERGPFVVDGDLHLAHRVSVRAGPTLRILAPNAIAP